MEPETVDDIARRIITAVALGETPRWREAQAVAEAWLEMRGEKLDAVRDAATNQGLHTSEV